MLVIDGPTLAQEALMSRQFRWADTSLDGKRLYHKKSVGTVEHYPDANAARRSVVGLVSELNTHGRSTNSVAMTIAQLCEHFRYNFSRCPIANQKSSRLVGTLEYAVACGILREKSHALDANF
jgi:hypothetical protein